VRPTATVAIPTRARASYLEVALRSVVPQATALSAEVLVISDGLDPATAAVAERAGARLAGSTRPRGLNASRNQAIAEAGAELIVFVDDDVWAPSGWLAAMLAGAAAAPDVEVFGGPITPVLEGGGPHGCGREPAPITSLDLGDEDRDASAVWGANMAIRASAFERLGAFDESLADRGDEEDWLRRYVADGGRIRYLAAAGLEHRRTAADARLSRLCAAAYRLGRTARRNDVRKGAAPSPARELRNLGGGAWHALRRRCAFGIVFVAHALGRLHESATLQLAGGAARSPVRAAGQDDFVSGASGTVSGIRATALARLADAVTDGLQLGLQRRLRRAAVQAPSRRVLVLAVERTGLPNLLDQAEHELRRSHHDVSIARIDVGGRGKFENLNLLLADQRVEGFDWLIALDDDVALPKRFLDEFIFLAERFGLAIAQPAHRRYSHAAWNVTRRRLRSVVRETAFVEIGPVVGFQACTFSTLLPFPPLRAGWGLDAHWSALADERGWKIGVVDATAVEHALRPVAAGYDPSAALREARRFLADRPYVRATEARRTLTTHRRW
jgi:GT2 family glycosyltransferase